MKFHLPLPGRRLRRILTLLRQEESKGGEDNGSSGV